MRTSSGLRHFLLAGISPLALLMAPAIALAQTAAAAPTDVGEVTVTTTRRDSTVQDAPVNIAAVGAAQLQEQGIVTLNSLASIVPGLTIVNQGSRGDQPIIVRGLNANPLASSEALNNDGGGTVATYVGEIPFYIHLRLNDMERVEVLLGPQGTLYGAGTLAGAIRYIPNRPSFSGYSADLRLNAYGYSEGSGVSTDAGFTVNAPLSDTFALRASVDYLNDNGFVDYPFVVNTIGVSDPDPNFNSPASVAANTHREEDVNTERTFSARAALRWRPVESLDLNLTYYRQRQDVGGRQISSALSTVPGIGPWEANLRVVEPQTRTDDLVALEASLDLGFAQLTSATGWSQYRETGQRDQTDLLISLEFSYEAFPSFTAFTLDTNQAESWTQELRLVSSTESRFGWIAGAFFNHSNSNGISREFTPNYDTFLGTNRPDDLEYISEGRSRLTELAAYGELSYQLTPAWQVTVGGRYYHYDLKTEQAADTPLFNTFLGAAPDAITLNFEAGGQRNSGFLYKFNTSYRINPNALAYFTISQGYRIGNSNGVPACPVPLPQGQNICGQPNELAYQPDKTTNFELGLHSDWFDRRLRINGAVYYVNWENPQVSSATLIGLQPITRNAPQARSYGVELGIVARPIEHLTISANYAYVHANLTAPAPNLVPTLRPPGFQGTVIYLNGQSGDRLPGSPEHKGSLRVNYEYPISAAARMNFSWEVVAQSNVLSRVGGLGSSYTLPSFTLHNAQVSYEGDGWSATLFANNVFNEEAQTGARATPLFNQTVSDANGDQVRVRSFFLYVGPPRQVGVRLTRRFG